MPSLATKIIGYLLGLIAVFILNALFITILLAFTHLLGIIELTRTNVFYGALALMILNATIYTARKVNK